MGMESFLGRCRKGGAILNEAPDRGASVATFFLAFLSMALPAAAQSAPPQAYSGLNVIEILSEPIAAAISYESLKQGMDRTILVFDLGGGTFDTTVITMRFMLGRLHRICSPLKG